MPFTAQQKQAIESRGSNILVSASAGSGKTSVLVERLCQLVIHDHISIDHILAMTFTNDAAAEMKNRLRQRLLQEEQTDYIKNQLAVLETADICTIDSFCLKIVKNYYYQIPISLKMANSVASDAQKQTAFKAAYEMALTQTDVTELLSFFTIVHPSNALEDYVSKCIAVLAAKPNPETWMEAIKKDTLETDEDTWFIQFYRQHIQAIIEVCKQGIPVDEIFTEKLALLEPMLECDYSQLGPMFKVYIEKAGYMRANKDILDKDMYNALKDKIRVHEKILAANLFDQSTFEQDQNNMKMVRNEFCDLVLETYDQFRLIKADMEIIDFSDMESMTYQLLQNHIICNDLYKHYEMILVDEFQDTNDLQESIIGCFAHEDNVFRVGDVKQSIYGFRQARPDIMMAHMKNKEAEKIIIMNNNFRSNQSIIDFNNDFYQHIMNSDLLGRQFEKKDYAYVGADFQVNTKQYPVRFIYTEKDEWKGNHDDVPSSQISSLHRLNRYDIIAHDILDHHKKGIPFKDICILTRSHSTQKEILDCLEAYEIPAVSDLEKGFYLDASVQTIAAAILALYDPYDDISLCAALLSPLIGVNTNQLSETILQSESRGALYERIKEAAWMKPWRQLQALRIDSPSKLLTVLYAQNDYYFAYTTSQNKVNLDALLEKASEFEKMDPFVTYLKQNFLEDTRAEAVQYGKRDDVVQIKTMHHAKGLQFPIVYILSQDRTNNKGLNDPIQIDADLGICVSSVTKDGKIIRPSKSQIAFRTKKYYEYIKEEMRVLYVATTRAEKELIIVDAIKNASLYNCPMDTSVLLDNQLYTAWLFHTYYDANHSLIQFEKKDELYVRPDIKEPISKNIDHSFYSKEVDQIESATASAAKIKRKWKPFVLSNTEAATRGTVFHEIMDVCPFPYQKEDIQNTAKTLGYTLTETDVQQLLRINEQPLYKEWMKHRHEFECSYIIQDNHTIVHGFMDFVAWMDDEIIILDYKTDHAAKDQLIDMYHEQLETYKNAMIQIDNSKPIHTWIYSFYLGTLIPLDVE